MDDSETDTHGERDGTGTDGAEGPPSWADLFERGAAHGVVESTVREALARRREAGND